MDLAFDARRGIPNSVLFPILVSIELIHSVSFTRGWQLGGHTDLVQEESLDLRCSTMIWATCAVVGIWTCWLGKFQRPLLCEHRIRARIVIHFVTSECLPLSLGISVLTPHSEDDRCSSAWQNAQFFMTSFLLFTLVICHADNFSSFSHSLFTAAFASRIVIAWSIGMNLCSKLWWLNEFSGFFELRSSGSI